MSWGATGNGWGVPARKLTVRSAASASVRALGGQGLQAKAQKGKLGPGVHSNFPSFHSEVALFPGGGTQELVFHGERAPKLQPEKQCGAETVRKTILPNASLIPVRCF